MQLYVRKVNGNWCARVVWFVNGKRHEKQKTTPYECNDEDNRGKKAAEEYAAAWARKLNISDKGMRTAALTMRPCKLWDILKGVPQLAIKRV